MFSTPRKPSLDNDPSAPYGTIMIEFHSGNEGGTFIVYRLDMVGDGFTQPIHVGCVPLTGIGTFADAKARTGWHTTVSPRDRLALTILAQSEDLATAEALRAFHEAATSPRPALADSPIRSTERRTHTGPVQCVETGQTWRTSAALARELGVNPSAVSLHLSGDIKQLQGRRYIRTHNTEAQT